MAQLALPLSRNSDPVSSREAAESVKPGNVDLISEIGTAAAAYDRPVTADDIVRYLIAWFPDRWLRATIISAITRAVTARTLVVVEDELGKSDRGHACTLYRLGDAP